MVPSTLWRRLALLLLAFVLMGPPAAISEEDQPAETKPPRDAPLKQLFERKKPKVEVVADSIEYARAANKVIAKGNVVLRYQNISLTADYAEVETDTRKAYARGHVLIFRDEREVAKSDEVHYDFAHDTGTFPEGRGIHPPWYSSGQEIEQVQKGVKVVREGRITTCNLERPHYDIRAKKVTIYEGEKMLAWNVKFYILGRPVFWWPYLVIPLQWHNIPFSVQAGYNSKFGAYLFLTKGFSISKRLWGRIHADWRSKRGFGGGLDFDYDIGKLGYGFIATYWTQDKRAPTPEATGGPYARLEKRDRGRVSWRHRTDLNDHTFLLARYHRLADEFFLQDFFEREFRAEVEPQSFVTFTHNSDRYGFFTHVQKKMNSFEALVERLPQIRFDWKNQPFLKPWLYYESQLGFDNLSKRFGRRDDNQDAVRFDTFHEWSAPFKKKEIKFTPFVNMRGTGYTRRAHTSDGRFRFSAGYGLDMRTHFYKTFSTSFEKWGIEVNQLRHVFEPSIRYSGNYSTVSDETLDEFDAVDRVDDAQIVTFGLENRLQTKRVIRGRMKRVDIVSLNTFLSYEFHPDGRSRVGTFSPVIDGRRSSNLTILTQEMVLRPYDWLQYEVRFDYDMERDKFQVFNQDLLAKTRKFQLLFGHRFTNDLGGQAGSNQFIFRGKWVMNALWSLGAYIRWDTEREELEEWEVAATRDLHDFLLDFGYNVRNSDIDESNKELFFSLRLKGFPDIEVRGGQRASFSEPRIGETVAGASQFFSSTPHTFESY